MLYKACVDLGIPDKFCRKYPLLIENGAVTGDNTSHNVAIMVVFCRHSVTAGHIFGNKNLIRCFCHVMNLAAKNNFRFD